LPLNKK